MPTACGRSSRCPTPRHDGVPAPAGLRKLEPSPCELASSILPAMRRGREHPHRAPSLHRRTARGLEAPRFAVLRSLWCAADRQPSLTAGVDGRKPSSDAVAPFGRRSLRAEETGSRVSRVRAMMGGVSAKESHRAWSALAIRIPEDLRHRIRVYCVTHDLAVMDFITDAITTRLRRKGATKAR